MRVISKPRLRDFWSEHPDAQGSLVAWWKIATKADWANLQEVRLVYPHADGVMTRNGVTLTVFNIAGNRYRLLTHIVYPYHTIYVRAVLTHAEYDRGHWKR
jgi:mRNA interferase HigB